MIPICNYQAELPRLKEAQAKEKPGVKLTRSLTVDSGAAKSALPAGWLPEYALKDSPESLAGVRYVAANGTTIPDEGMKTISFITEVGERKNMQFAVAGVNKPLASVSSMCAAGNEVVFNTRTGSYVKDLDAGTYTPLRLEGGVFVMDIWVQEPPKSQAAMAPLDRDEDGARLESGFRRQARSP